MGRPKGVSGRYYSKEFKMAAVHDVLSGKSAAEVAKKIDVHDSLVRTWTRIFSQLGEAGLEAKKKPGNPLAKYINRKELTEVERLRYELAKAEIEIAKLKKVYEAGRRNVPQKK